ncbi:hypothetical protein CXF72_09835 [Psychromonas sp. MB-3u-54]|uniref:hypothetical protein n=1 Tax=Psychromonas sp. MB-3u-54 TaxID=2058319 RepID=UPI000C341746|nr:hypothetical protein [Psychromonas sp. MB-3u-54]PKH02803.1 hypothetical protein CXF72_09835 [Psychromonas sp. MB-3u-54]
MKEFELLKLLDRWFRTEHNPAKNVLKWSVFTVLFFWVFSMFTMSFSEYMGYASVIQRSGKSSAPMFMSIPIFAVSCYAAYFWRYTIPEKYHKCKKGEFGEHTLSALEHVVITAITLVLWVFFILTNIGNYTFYRLVEYPSITQELKWLLLIITLYIIIRTFIYFLMKIFYKKNSR